MKTKLLIATVTVALITASLWQFGSVPSASRAAGPTSSSSKGPAWDPASGLPSPRQGEPAPTELTLDEAETRIRILESEVLTPTRYARLNDGTATEAERREFGAALAERQRLTERVVLERLEQHRRTIEQLERSHSARLKETETDWEDIIGDRK